MPPQQRRRRIRSRLGRALTLGTATVIVLAGMTACSSPSPIDATEDCTDVGSQPTSELGSAEILLSSSGYLLYADGWLVVSADEGPDAAHAMQVPMMAPPDPAGSRWQPAYLGSCQLEAVDSLAAEELVEGELGSPMVTDVTSTTVTYYGGEEPVRSSAYALGHESSGDGLSRSDKHGREVIKALLAALDEAPLTGDVLPVETVQVSGEVEEGEPDGWPGPPLAELLDAEGCGELTGEDAREVYDYLSERTYDDVGWLRVSVVPPGRTACD